MFCETFCAAIQGIDGCMIQVEADVSDGLPCFSMVGFLASEVKEAKERVSIAIRNSGFRIPPKKITINLSPADFRKAGTGYDLAIAAAILGALGYFPQEYLEGGMLLGELSLDGTIQPINGVLPMVYTALEHGCNYCIVPADNIKEAINILCSEEQLEIKFKQLNTRIEDLECICFQKSLIFCKMLRISM